MNYLYDQNFLYKLSLVRDREIFVRITALNLDETKEEQQLVGRTTQGSISEDGNSAVRRSLSLSMNIDLAQFHTGYEWALRTKIRVEIGIVNNINNEYPSICWFPKGMYVLTSFNTSLNTNSCTVSIQGKDKMALLNGELGGTFTSVVEFDSMNKWDDKNSELVKEKVPIKNIIRNVVHTWGKEPFYNIDVRDLDFKGLELIEYRGKNPFYVVYNDDQRIVQILNNEPKGGSLSPIYYNRNSLNNNWEKATNGYDYVPSKVSAGETAGYRPINLIYPQELKANIGENVVTILDKIKNMLGDYEYFYNEYGRFVFQRKPIAVKFSWYNDASGEMDSPSYSVSEGKLVAKLVGKENLDYDFNNGELITQISNTPDIKSLKNDYAIWGTKKSTSGSNIAIHLRAAFQKKPLAYRMYNGQIVAAGLTTEGAIDWRYLIYRMAKDYNHYHLKNDYLSKIAVATDTLSNDRSWDWKWGCTDYMQYYQDLEAFWPELAWRQKDEKGLVVSYDDSSIGAALPGDIKGDKKVFTAVRPEFINNPASLPFWIEFFEPSDYAAFAQYSVDSIGLRTRAKEDKDVTSLFIQETPIIYFQMKDDSSDTSADTSAQTAYKYYNIPANKESDFICTSQGKSAQQTLQDWLYESARVALSYSVTCAPVYHLQPNQKIHLKYDKLGLDDDFYITKITVPLTYNGTMSLTLIQANVTLGIFGSTAQIVEDVVEDIIPDQPDPPPVTTDTITDTDDKPPQDIILYGEKSQYKVIEVSSTSVDSTAFKDISVLCIANKEIGYQEKESENSLSAGANNYTKYAASLASISTGYHHQNLNGYPWCEIFVDWCFYQAYGENIEDAQRAQYKIDPDVRKYGAGCTYTRWGYARANRAFSYKYNINTKTFEGKKPVPGDQIFYGYADNDIKHTGLVYKVDDTYVYTIEGNINNMVLAVKRRLDSDYIYGYGRPSYLTWEIEESSQEK